MHALYVQLGQQLDNTKKVLNCIHTHAPLLPYRVSPWTDGWRQ